MTEPRFRKDYRVRVREDANSMLRGYTGMIEAVDVTPDGKITYAVWLDAMRQSARPRTYDFVEGELEVNVKARFKTGDKVKIRGKAGVPILFRNRFGVIEEAYEGSEGTRRYDVQIDNMKNGWFPGCPEIKLEKRRPDVEPTPNRPADERTARTMAGVRYDLHYNADEVKISDPELYAALEFLREYADDDTDFDVLLRVRNGKLVYMGAPEGAA